MNGPQTAAGPAWGSSGPAAPSHRRVPVKRLAALSRADRAEHAQPTALALIGAVRDMDGGRVADLLMDADKEALIVVLAAMVPDDATVNQLLGWTATLPAPRTTELRPHGTHAAYARHKEYGEDPCIVCLEGERAYQRARKRNDRMRKAAAS